MDHSSRMTPELEEKIRSMSHTKPWTAASVVHVATNYMLGVSASQLMAAVWNKFGISTTRSAILGKMHRMGIVSGRDIKETKRRRVVGSRVDTLAWTQPMDDRLIALHRHGVRPKGIAETLNLGFTMHMNFRHVRTRLITLGVLSQYGAGRPIKPTALRNYTDKFNTPPKHVDIVEAVPSTSVAFLGTSKDECKWPTSSDVRCMKVCGAPATCGAYCQHHATIAYRVMPTPARQARYHKRQEFDLA